MKLIAAGSFNPDGTLRDADYLPVGIERIEQPTPGVTTYLVHFSVNTHRNGTHRYRWFTQQRRGSEAATIEWYSPKLAKITFISGTGLGGSLSWWLLVVQDVPNGSDELDVIVKGSVDSNGDLVSNSPLHPWSHLQDRGLEKSVTYDSPETPLVAPYDSISLITNTDMTQGGCFWQVSQPVGAYLPQSINVAFYNPRLLNFQFRDLNNIAAIQTNTWHVLGVKFREMVPS